MTFEENLAYVKSVGCESSAFFSGEKEGGYYLQQNPEEMANLLTWLQEKFPSGITDYAEIGSASGGFIRCIFERVGFSFATMLDDGKWKADEQLKNIKEFESKVYIFITDSHSEEAHEFFLDNAFDVIMIDGDHEYEGVKQDIDLALSGSYDKTILIFHDIECEKVPGVKQAYEEAIKDGKIKEIIRWVSEPRPGSFHLGLSIARKA